MKDNKPLLIVIVIAAVIAICCLVSCCLSILFASIAPKTSTPEGMACTMEARLCPDGSYVGRNGANGCQFDPCPGNR